MLNKDKLPLYISAWYGRLKLCPSCLEYWPLDKQFYCEANGKSSGFKSRCIACDTEDKKKYEEKRRLNRIRITDEESK